MIDFLKARSGDLPFVSIIVPTYNRRDLLELTIRSFLNQDYPGRFNVLVLDDGDDETEDLINGFNDDRLVYMRTPRVWIGDKLNYGIRNSPETDFYALNGSDDYTSPSRISVHIYILLKTGKKFSGANASLFANVADESMWLFKKPEDDPRLLACGTTFGFSREVWEKAGGFITGWHKSGNDNFFLENVLKAGLKDEIALIDDFFPEFHREVICLHHGANVSNRFFFRHFYKETKSYKAFSGDVRDFLGNDYKAFRLLKEKTVKKLINTDLVINCKAPEKNADNIIKLIENLNRDCPGGRVFLNFPCRSNPDILGKAAAGNVIIKKESYKTPGFWNFKNEFSNHLVMSLSDSHDAESFDFKRIITEFLESGYAAGILNSSSLPVALSLSGNKIILNEKPGATTHFADHESILFHRNIISFFTDKGYVFYSGFFRSLNLSLLAALSGIPLLNIPIESGRKMCCLQINPESADRILFRIKNGIDIQAEEDDKSSTIIRYWKVLKRLRHTLRLKKRMRRFYGERKAIIKKLSGFFPGRFKG